MFHHNASIWESISEKLLGLRVLIFLLCPTLPSPPQKHIPLTLKYLSMDKFLVSSSMFPLGNCWYILSYYQLKLELIVEVVKIINQSMDLNKDIK